MRNRNIERKRTCDVGQAAFDAELITAHTKLHPTFAGKVLRGSALIKKPPKHPAKEMGQQTLDRYADGPSASAPTSGSSHDSAF